MCTFEQVYSYNLVIHHKDQEVLKKWPFRLDLKIINPANSNDPKSQSEASIYFDTKEKCDRWLAALDWIIENTSVVVMPSLVVKE